MCSTEDMKEKQKEADRKRERHKETEKKRERHKETERDGIKRWMCESEEENGKFY